MHSNKIEPDEDSSTLAVVDGFAKNPSRHHICALILKFPHARRNYRVYPIIFIRSAYKDDDEVGLQTWQGFEMLAVELRLLVYVAAGAARCYLPQC